MKSYIGLKRIQAKEMTRADYNQYRGWELPADENGDDKGYLVEYMDGGKPNHPGHAGYISWSPEDVFNKAYREAGNLTFGEALEALKRGYRVARTGWNGKGMWLSLYGDPTTPRDVDAEDLWSYANVAFALKQHRATAKVLACITMKTATDEILMGWLASQTDMLAEDWYILSNED